MAEHTGKWNGPVATATLVSGAMIAYQVGGKATRDAFYLSNFPVTSLPAMVIAAAALSLVSVLLASRLLTTYGPARLVPVVFASSAVMLIGEWLLSPVAPRLVAILIYLQFNALGALLISGFWSMVNERFDPRTAKRQIGRIGAAGTLGGVVGGILAERVGASLSVDAMLPVLAVLHAVCAGASRGLRPAGAGTPPAGSGDDSGKSGDAPGLAGLRHIAKARYLRILVLLVLLTTVAEGLIDYVFKAQATAAFGTGEDLIRLFATFYTGVALLAFVVQSSLSRRVLEAFGLTKAVAALPAGVAAGGLLALIVPGLPSAVGVRGLESVLRHSLYRSGFELLFTPIKPREKRAAKPIIDVGFVRLGDALGGGIVQLTLVLAATVVAPTLLTVAVLLSVAAVVVANHLQRGYVRTLEKNLISRAVHLRPSSVSDSTTRSVVLQTMGTLVFTERLDRSDAGEAPSDPDTPAAAPLADAAADTPVPKALRDPEIERIAAIRSGDVGRVRAALASEGPPSVALVAHLIPLLAWDEVAVDAANAIAKAGPRVIGLLTDHLLNPHEEFAVRRRIPALLASCVSERAVDGLFHGLADKRFEVRYRCGRALSQVHDRAPDIALSKEQVYEAVLREVNVDKGVWESQRLLDTSEDDDGSPFVDDYLRDRASRSLEHVFTILALVLPRKPLTIAFRGLHTDDEMLRGTALEYLESALPDMIRGKLWPFLEDRRRSKRDSRPREEILADLARSNESIAINLESLRKRHSDQ